MLASSPNMLHTQQQQPSQSPSPAPAPVAAGPITSSRVARAIADLNTKYPTHRFCAKPDGGLVIDEISTGERATSCPDPECARVFAYKRSNCVSRHVQTEHAPDTLPFVCCAPCTSRTNRRDHFVAHLARKKAQCAAAILARWTESDIDLMMKLVYPNAARQGYGAWRQALVHDTNPEHLEAQLRKLGMSIGEVLGQVGHVTTTPNATPLVGPLAAAATSGMLPPMPVSPLTHSMPVSMPPTSLASSYAAPAPATHNVLVPDWATLSPPPPPPAAFMSDMQFQPSYQPHFAHTQAQFPALASTAWESWPPAPTMPHTFHQPMLAPASAYHHASVTSSPMIPAMSAAPPGSMTPDPQLPSLARFDFEASPFLTAHAQGGMGALPSPATSPMALAASAAPLAVVNGLMSPTLAVGPTASRKRSRSAAQADEAVTDYDALLFGFPSASASAAHSQAQSGNGDSHERDVKRFRVNGIEAQGQQGSWLQLPSPVLAPVAMV